MILEHTLHIEAPVERVWAATVDVETWPDWTPTVTAVRKLSADPLAPGSLVRLKQPLQRAADWTVTELVPRERFVWETRQPGLRIVAGHFLTEREGGIDNRLRVEMSGPVAILFGWLITGLVRRALEQENSGLKRHCEKP